MRCGHVLVAPQGSLVDQYAAPKTQPGTASPITDATIVEIQCAKCRRVAKTPKKLLVARIAQGRTSCQFCGAPLELPADLVTAASSIKEESSGPRRALCPCCGRAIMGETEILACAFCSMRVRVDSAGRVLFGPAPGSTPYDASAFASSCATLPAHGIHGAARAILAGRAGLGELQAGEGEELAAALVAIESWTPRRYPTLPVSVAQAERLIPRTLFRSPLARSGEDKGTRTVILTFPRQRNVSIDSGALAGGLVSQAIGTMAAHTLGVGWTLTGAGWDAATQQNEVLETDNVYVRLTPEGAATRLSFARELFGQESMPFDPSEQTHIAEEIAKRRPQMLGYFTLAALFGPSSHGTPILAATIEKIRERLEAVLGKDAPNQATLANALRFKHDPIDIDPRVKL